MMTVIIKNKRRRKKKKKKKHFPSVVLFAAFSCVSHFLFLIHPIRSDPIQSNPIHSSSSSSSSSFFSSSDFHSETLRKTGTNPSHGHGFCHTSMKQKHGMLSFTFRAFLVRKFLFLETYLICVSLYIYFPDLALKSILSLLIFDFFAKRKGYASVF